MVEINLLPWRAYQRSYEIKQMKKMLLFTGALVAVVMVGVYFILSGQEKRARTHIAILKKEIASYGMPQMILSKPVSHTSKKLFPDQRNTQKIFLALANENNKNICFTGITRQANKMVFSGNARSATDLTAYLLHWQASTFFSEIKMEQIEQQDTHVVRFRFQALENRM